MHHVITAVVGGRSIVYGWCHRGELACALQLAARGAGNAVVHVARQTALLSSSLRRVNCELHIREGASSASKCIDDDSGRGVALDSTGCCPGVGRTRQVHICAEHSAADMVICTVMLHCMHMHGNKTSLLSGRVCAVCPQG
jgi:hypothetical protein